MNLQIVISSEAPEALLEKITQYWVLENDKFKYNRENFIEDELELTTKNILKYSHCLLMAMPCNLCNSNATIKISSRAQFHKEIMNDNLICDYCKMFSPNFNKDEVVSEDLYSKLELLTNEEYNILIGIMHLKTKFLIYRHIFNNDIEDSNVWEIINKLQKIGLIWIERDCSWKIKSFHYNPKLNKILEDLDI